MCDRTDFQLLLVKENYALNLRKGKRRQSE